MKRLGWLYWDPFTWYVTSQIIQVVSRDPVMRYIPQLSSAKQVTTSWCRAKWATNFPLMLVTRRLLSQCPPLKRSLESWVTTNKDEVTLMPGANGPPMHFFVLRWMRNVKRLFTLKFKRKGSFEPVKSIEQSEQWLY